MNRQLTKVILSKCNVNSLRFLLVLWCDLYCLTLFGATWWSVGIAVGTAISVMMLTRTTHPPAGSNPVIIYLAKPAWTFLLFPTAFGAIVLILVALLYNNFTSRAITEARLVTAKRIAARLGVVTA